MSTAENEHLTPILKINLLPHIFFTPERSFHIYHFFFFKPALTQNEAFKLEVNDVTVVVKVLDNRRLFRGHSILLCNMFNLVFSTKATFVAFLCFITICLTISVSPLTPSQKFNSKGYLQKVSITYGKLTGTIELFGT